MERRFGDFLDLREKIFFLKPEYPEAIWPPRIEFLTIYTLYCAG
jgi:hypothetical protein